ncbi:MAG TPA: DUF4410 domain-containing protein, partial [Gammaproteobacteria bacterium]|nr:DUF4410 domain-containing protein [Gammaproteobacteria bacterium]
EGVMQNKLTGLLVTLAAILATGCAAVVQPSYQQPPTVVNPGKVVYVSLSAAPDIKTDDEDYSNSMTEFKSELTQKFSESLPGTNLAFSPPPAGSNLGEQLNITVTDFNYVSGAGRFWGGIFAGHAKLQVHVVITDLKDGKQLDDASFGTSSSNGEGVFGATTSRQLDSVSSAIVRLFGGQVPSTSTQ